MSLNPDKIYGSLLGLVLADSLGACFEGVPADHLRQSFINKHEVLDAALGRTNLQYTDDGQMALALAEYLVGHATIESHELMRCFVQAYESWRGYGRGARALLEAFRDDADYEFMAQHLFPGGSLGNGGAMRSPPVGLRFFDDPSRVWIEARHSAWPTHRHELGIEGAQLIALATTFAATQSTITPALLGKFLQPWCETLVFQKQLERLIQLSDPNEIQELGNGIEAHESVVTALACFVLHPQDYREAVATAIWQGGDTDTIAAMTGALVGAHLGSSFATTMPLDILEEGPAFIDYLQGLAERLGMASDVW